MNGKILTESIVYAFRASTGNLLWSTHVAPYMFHAGMQIHELIAMTLLDDILYVLSSMSDIYVLDSIGDAIDVSRETWQHVPESN